MRQQESRQKEPFEPVPAWLEWLFSRTGLAVVVLLVLLLPLMLVGFSALTPDGPKSSGGNVVDAAGNPQDPADPSSGSSATAAVASGDPVLDLIERARKPRYRRDVATGRFHRDYSEQSVMLRNLDTSRLHPVRRGVKWVIVEVPYRENHSWDGPKQPEGTAHIRLVQEPAGWKIENVRVVPEQNRAQIVNRPESNSMDFYERWRETESQ